MVNALPGRGRPDRPGTAPARPVGGAEAGPAPSDGPVPAAERIRTPPRPRRAPTTVVTGLLVAAAIVAITWYVGGRLGFDQIGRGGVNSALLPKVGEAAPDLVALNADGEPALLSDFRGQPVWLNFWGSWCPPCRAEMPDMQAAYERLAPRGMVLLAVSLDEPREDAVRYARLNGATYPILSDPYRKGSAAYPIANFPTHILIDRDGIVRDVVLAELDEEEIVAHAEAILGPQERSS